MLTQPTQIDQRNSNLSLRTKNQKPKSKNKTMNAYAQDLSLFDYGEFGDLMIHHHHDRTSSRYHDDDDDCYNTDVDKSNSSKSKAVEANRRSPPRHRHDGTSPLPLGMDWSTPPRKWDGQDSVWPHDPHTGWSYCVTVPSWVLLPNSRGSDPVAFYRVQIGIQSPEGFTSTRGVLRRYSDFLKLLSELKKIFPKKELPQAPPKRILRLKSRTLLEERRCALEDWMEKLLSDIDISRSAPVATFLELEAAARSSFNDQQNSDAHSSISGEVSSFLLPTNSDASVLAGSLSVASDHGNDSPDERSELGTPRNGRNNSGDLGLEYSTSEQNINAPLEKTVKYGMFNRNSMMENLGKFSRQKVLAARESSIAGQDKLIENTAKLKSLHWDGADLLREPEYLKLDGHVRRLSSESVGSDLSSVRASEISIFGVSNLFGDGSLDHAEGSEASGAMDAFVGSDSLFVRNSLVALPSDQRLKLNRVLNTMQQRLATAKTDMEDLLARLNQEVTVRQFLTTKVFS
ncbi:hypothetical protein Patl1_34566 [Pistacia atlantica]|uniref:Uncharacterized protein n=1 Tax=Pistacia atlantica TaxID=434234 RepID=A0ACC0ZVQ4_9ROSI|nr:hypothetical protein Patl1_34566 [Pistacia atlantica]